MQCIGTICMGSPGLCERKMMEGAGIRVPRLSQLKPAPTQKV